MIFGLWRKDPREDAIDRLHVRIVDASRAPGLYRDLGIPDTLEGRFESLVLHVVLLLRRLRALPAPAPAVAQDLVDRVFRELDRSLREMGVGDMGVPKRMKKLAGAFYGRARAYDAALAEKDDAALAAALGKNAIGTAEPAPGLAAYVREAEMTLAEGDLDAILGSGPRFPEVAKEIGR